MQVLGPNSNINCVPGQINGSLMYQHIPLSPTQQQPQQSGGSVDNQNEINSSHVSFLIFPSIHFKYKMLISIFDVISAKHRKFPA